MNCMDSDPVEQAEQKLAQFEAKYSDQLDKIEDNPDEISNVVLPQKMLDQFIGWCKSNPAFDFGFDPETGEDHGKPFPIYTADRISQEKDIYNLIMGLREAGDAYEDYQTVMLVSDRAFTTDEGELQPNTIDFRAEDGSYSQWAMGTATHKSQAI